MINHDEGPKGIESRILGKVGILSFKWIVNIHDVEITNLKTRQ